MKRLLEIREFPVALAFLLVIVVTGISNSQFLTAASLRDILVGTAVVATLAVGQTFIIIMKHIDISVGSTAGLVAFLIGNWTTNGMGLGAALVLGLCVGALIGVFNGLLVAYLELPSLVVSLGSLYAVRGIFNNIAGGTTITADNLPKPVLSLGADLTLGIPHLFIAAVIMMVLAGLYLRFVRAGRDLYAIGSNFEAAKLAGIPVKSRIFGAFVTNSVIASIAGFVLLARFSAADATTGTGIELGVVAACVVGGVAIAGGVGTTYGAIIGALLLQGITLALGAVGVSQFWQQAVGGILLLAAITLDRVIASRQAITRTIRAVSV